MSSGLRFRTRSVYRLAPLACPTCEERPAHPYAKTCMACGGVLPPFYTDEEATPLSVANKQGSRLLHLSDLHVSRSSEGTKHLARLERWLRVAEEVDADVVVVSGDLVDKPEDDSSLLAVQAALETSRHPFVVVPGNHDLLQADRPKSPFYQRFGSYPRVSLEAGFQFLLLDSNRTEGLSRPMKHVVVESITKLRGRFGVLGSVGSQQTEALDCLLAADPSICRVIVLHHHVARAHDRDKTDELALGVMDAVTDAVAVRQWAARRSVRLILHGHRHDRHVTFDGQALVVNGGSSTKPRNGQSSLDAWVIDSVGHALIVTGVSIPARV